MTHPVLAAAASVAEKLKAVADVNTVFMAPAEKAEAVAVLGAVAAQVAELRLRILAASDDLAAATGAANTAAWLTATQLVDRRTAHAEIALASELETYDQARTALAHGALSLDHARVVTHVLSTLPEDLDPEMLVRAEGELVRLAGEHTPSELRRLGAHLLDVIAPEIAEEVEARRLADLERDAAQRTRLSLKALGDGTTRITGLVPDAVGERLRTVLEAFAQPRKAALDADGRAQPRARLFGHALGDLLETLDPRRLPLHGGDATTVMVTIGLEQLQAQLGTAALEATGLTATEVRRLACTAKVLPAVLGGKGEVLDLGRARRLFSPAQRKALRLRHPVCAAEGCTVPARWCEAHHAGNPWSMGGKTNLAEGTLLCTHHHHRAHDPGYDTQRLANGDYRFHGRT